MCPAVSPHPQLEPQIHPPPWECCWSCPGIRASIPVPAQAHPTPGSSFQAHHRPCRLCCSRIPWECGVGAPQAACPCSCTWPWIPTAPLSAWRCLWGLWVSLWGFIFLYQNIYTCDYMRKASQGDLACSEVSPEQMGFGFGGILKFCWKSGKQSVILCVSAEEVA